LIAILSTLKRRYQGKSMNFLKRNKKLLLGLSVIFILILVAVFVFFWPINGLMATVDYQTEVVEHGNLTVTVGATGTVRAYQSVKLSWETSGVVESVNTKLGDSVQAGDVLAILEKPSLPQNVIQAKADLISSQQALEDLLGSAETEKANAAIALREAQEAYDDAVNYRELLNHEVKYEYMRGLKRTKIPGIGWMKVPDIVKVRYYPGEEIKTEADEDVALAKAKLEDAKRTYDRVKDGPYEGEVAAAEARVVAAQAVLDQANLTSPFDGVITDIHVQPGDRVEAGALAFRVDNLSNLLIDLEVSELDINSVSVGQAVTVDLDAVQTKSYQGEVIELAGTSTKSNGGASFRATVQLSDVDELVKPGMTAEVIIQLQEVEDVLLVPNSAIRMLNGQRVVYVLREDITLDAVEIKVGLRSDGYCEIVDGDLHEGDLIVLDPPVVMDGN
jgi:HlyD family secretion protein